MYERSYLRTQREEYLLQQLELEKQASEIFYHTMAITNALSPDEYFDQISRRSIVDIIKNDSFGMIVETVPLFSPLKMSSSFMHLFFV